MQPRRSVRRRYPSWSGDCAVVRRRTYHQRGTTMITHMRSATGLPARRIRNVSAGLLTIVAVTVLAQPALSQMGDTMEAPTSRADTVDRGTMQQPMMGMSEATMDIPHPFFTHMGLPD